MLGKLKIKKFKNYKEMEQYLIYGLIADVSIFVLYLIFAGMGIIWLKVILAILGLGLSGVMLAYLYMTREILRPRSLWITTAVASIIVCLLFSLLLKFPSPKYELPEQSNISNSQSE